MNRRSILRLLGGAAAAGPAAVSEAAEASSKLSLGGLAVPKPQETFSFKLYDSRDPREVAKNNLRAEFEEILPEVIERRRQRHSISALDPNVASLKSISLPNKIRMTRDIDFERSRERRRSDLEGAIAGWWGA